MKDWKAIAEKCKEIIELNKHEPLQSPRSEWDKWRTKIRRLESELSALESQEVEGMSAKAMFDKRYEYYRNMLNKPAIPLEAREMIFGLMEEYANSSKVTDLMIEKWANKISNNNFSCSTANIAKYAAIVGAKALRDGLIKPE